MCPACRMGDHIKCYDGDINREQAEFNNTFNDAPVPWFGCSCDCQDGVLLSSTPPATD